MLEQLVHIFIYLHRGSRVHPVHSCDFRGGFIWKLSWGSGGIYWATGPTVQRSRNPEWGRHPEIYQGLWHWIFFREKAVSHGRNNFGERLTELLKCMGLFDHAVTLPSFDFAYGALLEILKSVNCFLRNTQVFFKAMVVVFHRRCELGPIHFKTSILTVSRLSWVWLAVVGLGLRR